MSINEYTTFHFFSTLVSNSNTLLFFIQKIITIHYAFSIFRFLSPPILFFVFISHFSFFSQLRVGNVEFATGKSLEPPPQPGPIRKLSLYVYWDHWDPFHPYFTTITTITTTTPHFNAQRGYATCKWYYYVAK